MASLVAEGKQQYFDDAGLPLVGGKLYTYQAGTTTPKPVYSDVAGTIPLSNPVVLDSRGEATIFWNGNYKVVLADALDNIVWVVDGVGEGGAAGYRTSSNGSLITPSGTTLQRDAAPSPGYFRYNLDVGAFEGYFGSGWGSFVRSVNGDLIATDGDIKIKTVNGTEVVGTGDITVQEVLVSGGNIKTVNGASLLGSGNIAVFSNITTWVSGQSYTVGETVYSPLNNSIYRCILATSGTIDPSLNVTNWAASSKPVYGVATLQLLGSQNTANTVTFPDGSVYLKTGVQVTRASAVSAGWDVATLEAQKWGNPSTATNTLNGRNRVISGNGVYIAWTQGNTANALRSTDGLTWTAISGGGYTGSPCFWFAGGIFFCSPSATSILQSTDGITWLSVPHPSSTNNLSGVGYANGRWFITCTSVGSWWSSDLLSWTPSIVPGSTTYASGNGRCISPGSNAGISFSYVNNLPPKVVVNTSFTRVTYAGGKFVALSGSTIGWTSTDGITWSSHSTGIAVNGFGLSLIGGGFKPQIAYGAGLYVTVGSAANNPISSPDGVVWTQRSASTPNTLVVYVGTKFFLFSGWNVPASATVGMDYSADGVTWTAIPALAAIRISAVEYGGGVYIAVGADNAGTTNQIWSSPDGVTWTLRNSSAGTGFSCAAWNGTQFVVAGPNNGLIYRSTNGTAWSTTGGLPTVNFRTLAWSNGLFVLAGDVAADTAWVFATSTNGTAWTTKTVTVPGEAAAIYAIHNDGNFWHLHGANLGGVCSYDNGVTWYSIYPCHSNCISSNNNMVFDNRTEGIVARGSFYTNSRVIATYDGRVWMPTPIENITVDVFSNPVVVGGVAYYPNGSSRITRQTTFPMGLTTLDAFTASTGPVKCLAYGGGIFYGSGTAPYTGTTGNAWTQTPVLRPTTFTVVLHNGTNFIANDGTNTWVTADGLTGSIGAFTAITAPSGGAYYLKVY